MMLYVGQKKSRTVIVRLSVYNPMNISKINLMLNRCHVWGVTTFYLPNWLT